MKLFRNWIRVFFVSFIISIIIVSLFNFFVDSAGIFGNKSYLSKAVQDLVDGNKIAGLDNYDERVFQQLIIQKNQKKVDTIALGSSRSMMIRKRYVESTKFFNHSVSGASLEDYIAIVDLYETKKKYIPKYVIIGVDPWIFNKFNAQLRWRSLKDNYFHLFSKIMHKSIKNKIIVDNNRWKQLINYEYTISNILFLKKNFRHNPYSITNTIDIESSIRDIDDSLYYPLSQRTPKEKEVKESAINYAKDGQVYSLEKFDKMSNIEEFENFINYLKRNGVKVTFVLFPYHPISYDLLINNPKYAIIQDVESYLRKFAKNNNIEIIGSYNPHKYNFTNKDFMDGMHGLEIVTETIFKEYKRD